MEKIYRAGMIPYYYDENGEIQMMFMKPSNKIYCGDVYQIAKGRQDDENEKLIITAIREAKEELGLKQKNIKNIDDLGFILGRTRLFICEIIDKDDFDFPHFETESVLWMTLEQFIKIGRDIHIMPVRDAVNFINEKNNQEASE